MPTARIDQNSADFCRSQGWSAGTVVLGSDDGRGPVEVLITAIGEEAVLGRAVGPKTDREERLWSFHWRDWTPLDGGILA